MTKKRGFTLIELLFVISIIGLLASIVLASLQEVRVKARDVAILEYFKHVQTALELYKETNGEYPNGRYVDWLYSEDPNYLYPTQDPATSFELKFIDDILKDYIKYQSILTYPSYRGYWKEETFILPLRCSDDASIPPYVLLYKYEKGPLVVPHLEYFNTFLNINEWQPVLSFKCLSP